MINYNVGFGKFKSWTFGKFNHKENRIEQAYVLAFIFKFYLVIDIYSEAGQRSLKNFNRKDGLFGLLIYLLILYI